MEESEAWERHFQHKRSEFLEGRRRALWLFLPVMTKAKGMCRMYFDGFRFSHL